MFVCVCITHCCCLLIFKYAIRTHICYLPLFTMLILILQNINFELKQCIYIKTLVLTYSHHALKAILKAMEKCSAWCENKFEKKVKNIHTKKPFPLYHVVQIFNVLCSDAAAEGDKFIVHAIKIEYIKIQICSIQFSDKCARHCRSTWPPFMYLELIEFIAIS